MIKLFEDHCDATKYVCAFLSAESQEIIALKMGGVVIWSDDIQLLRFPVLHLRKITALECFDLFSSALGLGKESIFAIRGVVLELQSRCSELQIVTISEWVLEMQIPGLPAIDEWDPVGLVRDLNHQLNGLAFEEYGQMPVVDPQPSPLHVNNNLIKIGLR